MIWVQVYNPLLSYDPTHTLLLSSLVAAAPIVVLLGLLGCFGCSAPKAAAAGLAVALAVAVGIYHMPWQAAAAAAGYGAAVGLFPIGWIVLAAVFLYCLTVETGHFEVVKFSVTALSPDRRIQALLIAFSFGAFLEGAAGFGAPVAVSAAILIGTGFRPILAAGLALIANTAPVAFGGLGIPITTLHNVTGISEMAISQMAGRQLVLFSLIVPAWMVCTMSGWRGLRGVWPAVLVSGGSFTTVQFLAANYAGPTLGGVGAGLVSLVSLALFLKVWQPATVWRFDDEPPPATDSPAPPSYTRSQIASAWVPWVLLSVCVLVWGLPPVRAMLNGGLHGEALKGDLRVVPVSPGGHAGTARPAWPPGLTALPSAPTPNWWQRDNPRLAAWLRPSFVVPQLHRRVQRGPEVVGAKGEPENALYELDWLSSTGTGIFLAAILSAFWLRIGPLRFARIFRATLARLGWPLFIMAAMLAIAYITRYSGTDGTLGLVCTKTGFLYPFFAVMLGWLGVAVTGSDTSSNALFGSLQKITAKKLGLSPVLICTANSTGGVMGKMINTQSIVIAAAAINQPGSEGRILRFVFWHSVALASLMGLLVLAQAYVLKWMVPAG
jgi:lactate permease